MDAESDQRCLHHFHESAVLRAGTADARAAGLKDVRADTHYSRMSRPGS